MQLNSVFRLADGVQVRNEAFGLLFYDYRGPRLYFVPSKDLIDDTFVEGRQSMAALLDRLCANNIGQCSRIRTQLMQVLEALEGKGLIRGKSIC